MFALLQTPEHAAAKEPAGITLFFATLSPFQLKIIPRQYPCLKTLLHNTGLEWEIFACRQPAIGRPFTCVKNKPLAYALPEVRQAGKNLRPNFKTRSWKPRPAIKKLLIWLRPPHQISDRSDACAGANSKLHFPA